MATFYLDHQIFYTGPVSASQMSTSRGILAPSGNADLSAAVPGAPSRKATPHTAPIQDIYNLQRNGPGNSPDNAILLIDYESDYDASGDFNDCQSDATFPPLKELLPAPRNAARPNGVASTDQDANATPGISGDNDGKPLVTGQADLDNESVVGQWPQSRGREYPLPPSSASTTAPYELCHPYTLPNGSSDTAEIEYGHSVPQEATCSTETGGNKECLPCASSGSQEGTLRYKKSNTSDLATAEPTSQPPDSQDQVDRRRDISRDYNTSFKEDHRHTHPPDDGEEQDKEGSVVPPQAQENRANIPSLSSDKSDNERELTNTELSTQPSARHDQVNLQHKVSRRQRCDIDDEENSPPIVGSDAKQGKDEDVVRPPRGKRRKVDTSALTTRRIARTRQARPHCTNSHSRQAQRPPTQGPKRSQSQCNISKPQSSGGSALEEETVKTAFANFEEWPLEAVLKRVLVDGVATFQLQFTLNPCTSHRQNDHPPETQRRKSLEGKTSSTRRALSSRVASTAEEILGDEYFQVEEILDSRRRGRRREYLVRWQGYGHEHDSWEPVAHLEKCPEMLEQFHERTGLSTNPLI
ncbi:hypothetical protein QBC43DRAFT_129472 [Cladorrhinum sp. PSN259]|nr:hypothetical protein QBC43DRAFT_129472 [Cladorrhinum sp. PSN259]